MDTFARMRQLVGTTAEWAANDLIIGLGEIAIEIVSPGVNRMKMGDGAQNYSALPYYDPGLGSFVLKSGDTMTGMLNTPGLNVPDGGSATAPTMPFGDTSRHVATTAFVRDLLATRGQGDAIYEYGGATLGTPPTGKVIIDPGTDPVRQFAMSATDADGVGRFLTLLQPGDSLVITNEFTPVTYYARYDLVSTVTDHTSWVEFTAHLITFSGIAEAPPLNTRLKLTGYLNLATGDGPILGVVAGTGLAGGGNVGVVTVAIDPAVTATLASPAFTGNPTAPTPPAFDADTSIATTAFVRSAGGVLIRDVAVASPAVSIDLFSLPARTIELSFYCVPTTPTANLVLRVASGTTVNIAAGYNVQRHYATTATPGADSQLAQTFYLLSSGATAGGVFGKVHLLGSAVGVFGAQGVASVFGYPSTVLHLGLFGSNGDGLQLAFSTGNIAAGSYCRVIGWP